MLGLDALMAGSKLLPVMIGIFVVNQTNRAANVLTVIIALTVWVVSIMTIHTLHRYDENAFSWCT